MKSSETAITHCVLRIQAYTKLYLTFTYSNYDDNKIERDTIIDLIHANLSELNTLNKKINDAIVTPTTE